MHTELCCRETPREGTAQLGHWPWPVLVLFQKLGMISPRWGSARDEGAKSKGAAQGETGGAAGSQFGVCWAPRGAEVGAGGCFSLFSRFFPVFFPHHCHGLWLFPGRVTIWGLMNSKRSRSGSCWLFFPVFSVFPCFFPLHCHGLWLFPCRVTIRGLMDSKRSRSGS